MKRTVLLLTVLLIVFGCNNSGIEKPDNLISEDKMVDIIYDLAVLEGIRAANYSSIKERGINPSKYIYTKYKIDSLQFVKSDRYYASDIERYAKIYDRVTDRLEKQKKVADSLSKLEPSTVKTKKPLDPGISKDSALLKKKQEMLKKLNAPVPGR